MKTYTIQTGRPDNTFINTFTIHTADDVSEATLFAAALPLLVQLSMSVSATTQILDDAQVVQLAVVIA
jgi:hypothetical protein